MDDMLLKFKEIVDEEIQAYESLGELYDVKQSILIQGKSDALWDIDAKIVSMAEDIKGLNRKRKEVAKYLGDESITMSEIIEKAKEANNSLVGTFQTQKTKLNLLAKSISLQEHTNMTLIKHGLIMVGKTLDIIVEALMPEIPSGQYNKLGQSIQTDKSSISSVVEEA